MVHALRETWRVLRPGGTLIDLRPYSGLHPVEVLVDSQELDAGVLDETEAIPIDEAADRAIQQIADEGWFARERDAEFDFLVYWESPVEMAEFVTANWQYTRVPDGLVEHAQNLMAGHSDARLRVHLYPVRIVRYHKTSP